MRTLSDLAPAGGQRPTAELRLADFLSGSDIRGISLAGASAASDSCIKHLRREVARMFFNPFCGLRLSWSTRFMWYKGSYVVNA